MSFNTKSIIGSTGLPTIFFLVMISCHSSGASAEIDHVKPDPYTCLPCGQDCDTTQYNQSGTCAVCHMELVKKSTIHFKTIQPEEICDYIKAHPEVILLDVRTPLEFEGKAEPDFGTLQHAINIPVQSLDSALNANNIINTYKDKPIIVYCSHSHRSPRASYILTQYGFKDITNMAGGMSVMYDSTCVR